MKGILVDLEEAQIADLDLITTDRTSRNEWIRRSIDILLSQPAIMADLARARERTKSV